MIPDNHSPRHAVETTNTETTPRETEIDADSPTRRAANRAANRARAENEPAFAAFLSLDNIVDTDSPEDLAATFDASFVGEYADADQALNDLTNITTVENAVIDADFPVCAAIHIDYAKLWELINQRWDIVRNSEHLYVFEK